MRVINFVGSRVIKTGVAVFLTAFICQLFNWPAVFAVITAIVTIEPTVTDSIRKGLVRFPASVIGSAYAVLFISLFGNSPITYTLAAVFTILTCFKLNLHVGLLVATLTSVAMVDVIHDNFVMAFLIRLATTTTGLVVSTAVNMFVFPPDYTEDIFGNLKNIKRRTGVLLEQTFWNILNVDKANPIALKTLKKHEMNIQKTELLIRYQHDEATYNPLVASEQDAFLRAEDQLLRIRQLHYHLLHLNRLPLKARSWSEPQSDLIMLAVRDLAEALTDKKSYNQQKHQTQLRKITTIFWEGNARILKRDEANPSTFPSELIILYELVAIYELVDQLYTDVDE